ncbi:MAG: (Fe-S)-binding protein [Myxococcales bacterium]|nr:(Fe-S)-binding protein [Myxococcales bacterium]
MSLPLLEGHRGALESCTFCPKLCRAACPVSAADGRETTTPWGKMSDAFLVASGSLPRNESHAALAWACTGCRACRQACDLRNEPAETLFDARAEYFAAGVAPAAVKAHVSRRSERSEDHARAVGSAILRARARGARVDDAADVAVLVGCGVDADDPGDPLADAIVAAAQLVGRPVAVLRGCCGRDSFAAGDRPGLLADASALAASLVGKNTLVVADAECLETLRVAYPRRELALPPTELVHLVELAAAGLPRLGRLGAAAVRYHDACAMGRGLGLYEAPRQVLARVFGAAPAELPRSREWGTCSGGGGLLPETMPEVARTIAESRAAEHAAAGGGIVVTACPRAARNLRKSGVEVRLLVSVVAASLEAASARPALGDGSAG